MAGDGLKQWAVGAGYALLSSLIIFLNLLIQYPESPVEKAILISAVEFLIGIKILSKSSDTGKLIPTDLLRQYALDESQKKGGVSINDQAM